MLAELVCFFECERAGGPLNAESRSVLEIRFALDILASIFVARDNVEMDMVDHLTCIRAVVLENIACLGAGHLLDRSGDPWECSSQTCSLVIGEFIDGGCWFFGDDKGMSLREWGDIEDGNDEIVLVDLV